MSHPLFVFDLDGTVTTREILPSIASEAGMGDEIARLTQETLSGLIDFPTSFRRRFQMLKHIPLNRIQSVVSNIPLDSSIEKFIRSHSEQCVIATGNLDRWIEPLIQRLGCKCHCSTSRLEQGRLVLDSILDKGAAVKSMKARGHTNGIVAIGESVNDVPMFEQSTVRIAFGGVHNPVPSILRMADYIARDGKSLCRLLDTFLVVPAVE